MTDHQKLEKQLKDIYRFPFCLLTGFARNALFLLVKAKGWGPESQIIYPAFTCATIPAAIDAAGPKPIPVDVEPQGLNIDLHRIQEAVTPQTKAIYVVHTYGQAANIRAISDFAKAKGLYLIEDVAHCLLKKKMGQLLGTFGDCVIWSFTKSIINFQGGAIAVRDEALFNKMVALQKKTQVARPRSRWCIYFPTRVLVSVWEAKASLVVMLLLKILDRVNNVFCHGKSDYSVQQGEYEMHPWAVALTLRQLQNTMHHHYYGKVVAQNEKLQRFLSFRVWKNYHKQGEFPRSDALFMQYRLFPKICRNYCDQS